MIMREYQHSTHQYKNNSFALRFKIDVKLHTKKNTIYDKQLKF